MREQLSGYASVFAQLLGGSVGRTWAERAIALRAGVTVNSANSLYPLTYSAFEPALLAYARLRPEELVIFFEVLDSSPVLNGAFSIEKSTTAFKASGFGGEGPAQIVFNDSVRLLDYGSPSKMWYEGFGWGGLIEDGIADLVRIGWALTNMHRFADEELGKLARGLDAFFRKVNAELPSWPLAPPPLTAAAKTSRPKSDGVVQS